MGSGVGGERRGNVWVVEEKMILTMIDKERYEKPRCIPQLKTTLYTRKQPQH